MAQTLSASLAYVFVIISSFDSELGDPTTALQIASGSLWIWLVPVIWGWITVGTQANESSIENALAENLATRVTDADDRNVTEASQLV